MAQKQATPNVATLRKGTLSLHERQLQWELIFAHTTFFHFLAPAHSRSDSGGKTRPPRPFSTELVSSLQGPW